MRCKTGSDEKFLNSMLGSIKLIEYYQPDAHEEVGAGSVFYRKEDWIRAIQHYEKALELERKKAHSHPMADTGGEPGSGLRHGSPVGTVRKPHFSLASRRIQGARCSTYNLACSYAETNDLDSALADLKYAFAFWRNGISLEGMPDPTKDPSFKRFLENERFKTLAQ
jgi:tetratricopeptide (TPR) repeat protein